MSYRRRQLVNGGCIATPEVITSGSVTAWLDNATEGAVSSITDRLNSNPAVQSDTDRQPVGAADGVITWDGSDVISWPIAASNFSTTSLGVGIWYDPASVTGVQIIFAVYNGTGGASLRAFTLYASSGGLVLELVSAGTNGRRGTIGSGMSIGVPAFVTAEFNGALGTEAARHVITIDGVVQTLSFANLGVGGDVTSLNAATGNILLASQADTDVGQNPIQNGGRTGRDIVVGTAAMSGVTEGIWTSAARTGLKNYRPLT